MLPCRVLRSPRLLLKGQTVTGLGLHLLAQRATGGWSSAGRCAGKLQDVSPVFSLNQSKPAPAGETRPWTNQAAAGSQTSRTQINAKRWFPEWVHHIALSTSGISYSPKRLYLPHPHPPPYRPQKCTQGYLHRKTRSTKTTHNTPHAPHTTPRQKPLCYKSTKQAERDTHTVLVLQ